MSLPDFNISNHVHKRWCRFILQRYMGQFLERNLQLEQLSIDLSSGLLNIQEVNINVQYVNELLTSMNIPLRLVDGFIGRISCSVPWTSLVSDSSKLQVEDLQVTFQAKDGVKLDDKDLVASMLGSVVDSLVSSRELARSFCEDQEQQGEAPSDVDGPDGIKAFTKVIDAIVSRFCMELTDTTIRLENQPEKNSDMCTAIEFRIKHMQFMDEQMKNCQQEGRSTDTITAQPQGMGSITNLNKYIHMTGVEAFTDVFSRIDELPVGSSQVITSMYIRREKMKQKSPTHSPNESMNADLYTSTMSSATNFQSCYSNLGPLESIGAPSEFKIMKADPDLYSDPIKFAELTQDTNITLRIQNSETTADQAENRVDFELFCKGLHVFIAPSQLQILKKFFASVSLSPSRDSRTEMGKRMDDKDYDVIVKTMEDITYQNNVPHSGGMAGGNWRQPDNFREFDSINLDDRSSRNASEPTQGYKTLKNDSMCRKESLHLKASIGTMLVYVPHDDPLTTETVQKLDNTHHEAMERLKQISNDFFRRSDQLRIGSGTPLHTIREMTDQVYLKDHIRFVGSSVLFNYAMEKSVTGDAMTVKLSVTNCDCTEYLTPASNPSEPSVCHYPLLDFSEFENSDHEPHLKLIHAVVTGERPTVTSQIYIGTCRMELDLSLVDRIADWISPRSFFDNPSYGRGRLDSISKRENLHLSEDLFAQATNVESTSNHTWIVTCSDLTIDLRVPQADLRNPTLSRMPFKERHVHSEFIRLNLRGATIELPQHDDIAVVLLTCNEMIGDFCGLSDDLDVSAEERRFLYACKASLEKRIQIKFSYDPRNKSLKSTSSGGHLPSGSDDMTKSFSSALLQSHTNREGPFSRTRRQFSECEEDIIQAGSREEMEEFADECLHLSDTVIQLDLPVLRMLLASHPYLEVLYNRLVNDLALWQPAAPGLCNQGSNVNVNALAANEQFLECKGNDRDEEEDTLEEPLPSSEFVEFDRSKSHNFSLILNISKGNVLLGTQVLENDIAKGVGQVSLELEESQLFTVAGYHHDLNHTFFHFTTKKINVGHRNFDQFDRKGMMSKNVCQKDFGRWHKDEYQLETISTKDQFHCAHLGDALAVALHMHARPEKNIKDVLLAVAVRNTSARIRPFRDSGHLWVNQLVALFTLQDYEIPGYELPLVTNDIQVHLDNVVIAYDHSCVKPESNSRFRLVLGQTNISSSIILNMDISKFTCIFEQSRLYMSNEKVKESVRFDSEPAAQQPAFVQIMDVGLFHLEIFCSMLSESELGRRQTPLKEIRCKNDIIKVWACADSLVALINIFSEVSESESIRPLTPPVEEQILEDEVDSNCDDGKSEAASTWSRPASLAKPELHKLSEPAEQKLEAMLKLAMQDTTSQNMKGEAIAVGEDPMEEFSPHYSQNHAKDHSFDTFDDSHERMRHCSLSTDDEFCMVDDIIGSGITNAAGEPTIKLIGKKDMEDGITIDSQHFRMPDEWRADGMGALQEKQLPPLLRNMVRDVSIHVHLYGGSDLSKEEYKPRTYSCEDYRKGQGKGQKVTHEARGGPNRDHSVSVVLEINKITYQSQVFAKDSPMMRTTLFSVHDIVVRDRLTLSNIKELLYQYSNSEQPRRTCAPMLAVRMVESHSQEGKMRVSMLPIKMNIDQDTMNFLEDFVADVTNAMKLPTEVTAAVTNRPMIEVPAEPRGSDGMDRLRMPPETLNLEPLTPSPVHPPSPLGDLSYLVNRTNSHESPVKRPLIDGPLMTESAVSIGNLFGTRSRMTERNFSSPDSPDSNSSSPDLVLAEDVHIGLGNNFLDDIDDNLQGDWNNSSDLGYYTTNSTCRADDLLARSTMEGSIHPGQVQEDLVDYEQDQDNDRSTICDDDNDTQMGTSAAQNNRDDSPDSEQIRGQTFFKEFVFSPPVSIYVDYHGKSKISMEKGGAVLNVLKGFGQLNHTELVLKEIQHRNGLLGISRCANFALNEWSEDIITNLPNVLTSCGPISPLVQIGKGVMDLFWMPVSELRKEDGHVVKGLQKGVGSFGLSSAAGIVGIAQSMVGVVQMFAESVLYEVQPDSAYLNKRNRRITTRPSAPTDLRHGMQLAYGIVSDGVQQTKTDLELAAQEDRATGNSSFRQVLRFATPAVIRPLVMGSQISYQILGGLRNQLNPDMYQDERHKWRDDEVPGGSG